MNEKIKLKLRKIGFAAVARHVGCSRQAVHKWAEHGRVGAPYVAKLAPLIGMRPHQIRPDVFPAPEACDGQG